MYFRGRSLRKYMISPRVVQSHTLQNYGTSICFPTQQTACDMYSVHLHVLYMYVWQLHDSLCLQCIPQFAVALKDFMEEQGMQGFKVRLCTMYMHEPTCTCTCTCTCAHCSCTCTCTYMFVHVCVNVHR